MWPDWLHELLQSGLPLFLCTIALRHERKLP